MNPAPAPAPERVRVRLRTALLLGIVLACLGCDRATKQVAASELPGQEPIRLLGNTLVIQYAENRGAFLGLGADWPPAVRLAVLGFGTGLALVGLAAFLFRRRHGALLPLVGAALVLGGGLGNLADRLATGRVVDFLVVVLGPLRTGVFNAADLAITAGALLLFLSAFQRPLAAGEAAGQEPLASP